MSRALRAAIVIAGAVIFAIACQEHQSPIKPTRAAPAHVLLSVHIDGPDSLAPEASVQLHLQKQYADGTTEDATSQAVWSSSDITVVQISATGFARGAGRGAAQITAAAGLSAVRSMLVLEDGTFALSGRVLEDNLGVSGMAVSVTSGIGQGLRTLTDATGAYVLYGVAGAVMVSVSKDGYVGVTQSLLVQGATYAPDIIVHQTSGPTDFSGQWRLTIARAASCTALPDDTALRSYDVKLSQAGAKATMQLTSKDMWKGRTATVTAHVTGRAIDILLTAVRDGYYSFYSPNLLYDVLETLDGQRFLGVQGIVHLDGSTVPMIGALNGSFDVFAGSNDYWSARLDKRCAAADFPVAMTR